MVVVSVVNVTPFESGNPWSCRLGGALRPVAEQSPSGAGDAEADEDREAQYGVRRACTSVERDSRADDGNGEPDEERDEQPRGHRHAVLGGRPVEHKTCRSFEDGARAGSDQAAA